jgi:hypothetical protein
VLVYCNSAAYTRAMSEARDMQPVLDISVLPGQPCLE